MDQLFPEWYRESERWDPPRDLDYWLGEVLRAPVRGIPTVEDWQREQGEVLPPDATQSREAGRGALDYLTMAHGLANLLKGGGSAAQELMGKRRGAETFGKETMDTLRRAQPQRWRAMEDENLGARPSNLPPAADDLFESGRGSYRDLVREGGQRVLPPGETPSWRVGESLPPGAVTRAPLTAGRKVIDDAYHIGTPVTLPGEREAQYVVFPVGGRYFSIQLKVGDDLHYVGNAKEAGEALATAQKLQTRLTLAAKDFGRLESEYGAAALSGVEAYPKRAVRFPWERGAEGRHGVTWPYDYMPPPSSGRFAE